VPTLFHYAKHELHMAWRRWQLRRSAMPTGLADSAWLLHGLVRSMKPLACVEIGSAHGHSTCLIGLALKQNLRGRLWAVDPHEITPWNDAQPEHSYDFLRRNLRRAGVANYVEIVRKRTAAATADLPAAIDFAFIDGDHSYEGVKQDWEILRPRMREFSVVAFHDTMWDRHVDDPYYQKWRTDGMGVPRLLEDLRLEGYPVVTIDQDWGLTLVQPRVGGCTFTHRPAPTR
jgi:predicted O-methyltransferase YrrM